MPPTEAPIGANPEAPQASKAGSEIQSGDGKARVSTMPSLLRTSITILSKVAALLSALLLSGPVWMCISLAGPHMPELFVPTLIAAVLRLGLVFSHLLQETLDDGIIEPWEVVGVTIRFLSDVLITMNCVFPQPIFTTLIGGPFAGGDAARAGHMRMSRWLWRLTVNTPVELLVVMAVLIKVLPGSIVAKANGMLQTLLPGVRVLPIWLRQLAKAVAVSVCWTVFASRMKLLPFGYLLGVDPSSYLAAVVPDQMLMFRRELSLFHAFTSTLPWINAMLIVVGDGLMSNPAMQGYMGFGGALSVGVGLWMAGQPVQVGYWLAAGAWGMLALTDYLFNDTFPPPTSIDIGSLATVTLEEDDGDDAQGPNTSTAILTLNLPPLFAKCLGRETLAFETPFKIGGVLLALWAWWAAPYTAYSWLVWGGVWMVLSGPNMCCLPWLPNGANN